MRTFYTIIIILTLISCSKEQREKRNPKVLSAGYDGGNYKEVSQLNVSTSPIYELDYSYNQLLQPHIKCHLLKVYNVSGNSYKLSETVTFAFPDSIAPFEYHDSNLKIIKCQVMRNDDDKYYRIVKGYVKVDRNPTGGYTYSFDIYYKPDGRRKETNVSSWD